MRPNKLPEIVHGLAVFEHTVAFIFPLGGYGQLYAFLTDGSVKQSFYLRARLTFDQVRHIQAIIPVLVLSAKPQDAVCIYRLVAPPHAANDYF